MPIEIKDCDGGRGGLIVVRGLVTDQALIEFWQRYLPHDLMFA